MLIFVFYGMKIITIIQSICVKINFKLNVGSILSFIQFNIKTKIRHLKLKRLKWNGILTIFFAKEKPSDGGKMGQHSVIRQKQ